MFEIFRLQLRQILGGRKKWLVILFLILPILLTYVNMHVGGLRHLKEMREEWQRWEAKSPSEREQEGLGKEITAVEDPIFLLNGKIAVTKDGVFYEGEPVSRSSTLTFTRRSHGRGTSITIKDGKVWLNDNIPVARFRPRKMPPPWEPICTVYLFFVYPQAICLLLALLYGSSLLWSELDNKTLTYLFTRPLARWKMVSGKYFAIVLTLIPLVSASLLISWLLLQMAGGWKLFAGILVASLGGILAYNTVFILLGFLIPRRAMVLALIYSVVFEFLLSFVPALVNTLTVSYYLRSLVVEIARIELHREIVRIVGGASLLTSIFVLAGIVLLGLSLSSLLASRREYVVAEQV